jgi:hypothetical protein
VANVSILFGRCYFGHQVLLGVGCCRRIGKGNYTPRGHKCRASCCAFLFKSPDGVLSQCVDVDRFDDRLIVFLQSPIEIIRWQ